MNYPDLLYQIGITLIPNVGDVTAKLLISYCGSPEAVFKEKKKGLLKIPGVGETIADSVLGQKVLERAEKEIKFIDKHTITPLFYLDKNYPLRLKQCNDSPVMLYAKGNVNGNVDRIISIVGTRSATPYGAKMCEELISGLSVTGCTIVSGLAYGIDAYSHRAALDAGMPTVGVVAHGLDTLYPQEHYSLAEKMQEQGGMLTDFISGTGPSRENFPKRNRIIAGLADAVIVVESKPSGGAMITADIAFSYNREVMAVPGRAGDTYSGGCNILIQRNKAYLIASAKDVVDYLRWNDEKLKQKSQKVLFPELNPDEESIFNLLKSSASVMHIDDIAIQSKMSPGNLSTHLLTLEFTGLIKSLPGKMYSL